MKLKYFLLLLLFLFFRESTAQENRKLRVSLLTCGVGDELYSIYGHSAIRIIDSNSHTDMVYNYGTFDFGDPDFYIKFTRGKLLYYLASEEFQSFLESYIYEKRSVTEQVLNLSQSEAIEVQQFLFNNIKEENRYYKYDFLFDNCSTRIRDLFAQLFKNKIQFNNMIPSDSLTFRNVLDDYERNLHWERTGINLLMTNIVNGKMNSYQSMFLPDYLMKGFDNTTLNGNQLVQSKVVLLTSGQFQNNNINQPLFIFWALFLGIFILSFYPQTQPILKIFDIVYFLILGVLGIFILFMWFGTEHKVCAWNLNVFWASPLHLIFSFLLIKKSEKLHTYAKYAFQILLLTLFYNFFFEKKFIPELMPLIFLTLWRLNHYSKLTSFRNKIFTFKL